MQSQIEIPDKDIDLIKAAFVALKNQTGINGTILPNENKLDSKSHASLIELSSQNGTYQYYGECKNFVDRKITIARIKEQCQQLPHKVLLVTRYLSNELADYCRSIKLEFIDTAGNAYLNDDGLHIQIQGLKDVNSDKPEKGTNSPSVVKALFALLCDPELTNKNFREIAEVASIALGMVGISLSYLAKRGYLENLRTKNTRKLSHPLLLLDEWVNRFPSALLPKLNANRFSCPDSNWWQSVQLNNEDAAWGGEVAAYRLTNYLKPEEQILYIDEQARTKVLNDLVKQYRLRPDPNGKIEIRDKFWNFSNSKFEPGIAPPILVYADLKLSLEPRNMEVADMIKERHIDDVFSKR